MDIFPIFVYRSPWSIGHGGGDCVSFISSQPPRPPFQLKVLQFKADHLQVLSVARAGPSQALTMVASVTGKLCFHNLLHNLANILLSCLQSEFFLINESLISETTSKRMITKDTHLFFYRWYSCLPCHFWPWHLHLSEEIHGSQSNSCLALDVLVICIKRHRKISWKCVIAIQSHGFIYILR